MTGTDHVNSSPVITGPITGETALNLTGHLQVITLQRGGELYSVIFRGELVVDRSNDPECDAARALLAKGITGKLTMLDGKTGAPRTIVDIERAARVCVKEGPLRFGPYEGDSGHSSIAETEDYGTTKAA